ncbi:hypothetical protein [Streptomyces sp. NBC_00878]|uniref:hypothetical protein n=1 Tax=Streptomyces sp. NBC_00878 TaxID=2975854 RepID=UPI002252E798|nr:hypothetical protein [Streptomyces sp. NBC_00878]MCX4906466.1 hypothetical protein [Streptomyces sp. NBC_00878]
MAMLYGPADEVAGLVPVAEGGIGHPAFQVGLCAGIQGETFAGEPGEEVVGRGDVAAHVHVLQLSGVLFADSATESAQVVPDRVTVQDPAFGEVRASLDGCGDPFLQSDEPFVARRQGARRDEDAAKVSQRLARRNFVEDVVGDGTLVAAGLSYLLGERDGVRAECCRQVESGGEHRPQHAVLDGLGLVLVPSVGHLGDGRRGGTAHGIRSAAGWSAVNSSR